MATRKRTLIKCPTLFFVTTSTFDKKPLLTDYIKSRSIDLLFRTADEYEARIMAYVFMSTHIHLLCYTKEGGTQLSRFISSLRGRIRKNHFGNRRIWQNRFDDKVIRTELMLTGVMDYLHDNPVKAGLVEKAPDYRYSSASVWAEMKQDDRVYRDLSVIFRD